MQSEDDQAGLPSHLAQELRAHCPTRLSCFVLVGRVLSSGIPQGRQGAAAYAGAALPTCLSCRTRAALGHNAAGLFFFHRIVAPCLFASASPVCSPPISWLVQFLGDLSAKGSCPVYVFTRRRGANTAPTQMGRPTHEAPTREYTHKHTQTQTNAQRGPTKYGADTILST